MTFPASRRPRRVLAVLGMHRSGTSCLTGSLQVGGLFLGKHHTSNEYNRKGNRENQDVVNLHEAIFKSNGTNWKNASVERPIEWQARHYDRAREILEEYASENLWGFKDPRALFLLNGWQRLVPDIELVGIFRHPLAVAQSLNSRPTLPISIAEGLRMWLAYNRALLQQYQAKPFPLFCFDWSEEHFHDCLNHLHRQLQLNPIASDQRFYTDELHTQKVEGDVALSQEVETLYLKLKELEYQPA